MAVFLRYNLVFYGFVAQIPNTMIVLYLFLLKFIQTFKNQYLAKFSYNKDVFYYFCSVCG